MSGMFRCTKKYALTKEYFSVGSIIEADNGKLKWLVVGGINENTVTLIDMQTWCVTESIDVVDLNWLTEFETSLLTGLTHLNYTFSDYSFNSEGLKK